MGIFLNFPPMADIKAPPRIEQERDEFV